MRPRTTSRFSRADGAGDFQASIACRSTPLPIPLDTPQALAAGVFTANGLLDLAVASAGFGTPDHVSVLLNEGQGVFDALPPIPLGTGLNPTSIVAAPLFGSGPLDLAVADHADDAVSLLQGDGQGQFQVVLPSLVLTSAGYPNVIATGDFTGDGESDLAIALQSPNGVAIELNQGHGLFVPPGSVGLVPRNTPVVADFTGDGVPDVAIVDGKGEILFRQGIANEPGSFEPPTIVNNGVNTDYPSRDIAAVVTNKGILLASVDATDNFVSLFAYQNGQFTFVGKLATGADPAQIVAADLNGNNEDGLIIRNAGDGTLTIYMTGSNPLAAGFMQPITRMVGTGISDVSVADVNQDGRLDILLANQTSGLVEVILNLGDGQFSQPTLYRAGVGLSAVIGGSNTTPLSVLSQDGTIGVAAAAVTAGGPPDIVALNSGADTLQAYCTWAWEMGVFAQPVFLADNRPNSGGSRRRSQRRRHRRPGDPRPGRRHPLAA